ncbi:MAG: OB-fold nucleic acid binding domain-containing protein [Nanoarchaeota archaeon]
MPDQYARQPAVKIDISSLKQGTFIENANWEPSHIKTVFGTLFRVSIMGILIAKNNEKASFLIDDGTGTIEVVCNFSENYEVVKFLEIPEGNGIIIIGKPRKYGEDIYLTPEVIQKLPDLRWLKVRKAEIERQREEDFMIESGQQNQQAPRQEEKKEQSAHSLEHKLLAQEQTLGLDEKEEEKMDSLEAIYTIMKANDTGDGVNFQFVAKELEKRNITPGEDILKSLLERGEIFEIMPGMIKLLE